MLPISPSKKADPRIVEGDTLATCARGNLGLITAIHPGAEPNHPCMYRGIHLGTLVNGLISYDYPLPGQPWQSQCPVVLGKLSDITGVKRGQLVQESDPFAFNVPPDMFACEDVVDEPFADAYDGPTSVGGLAHELGMMDEWNQQIEGDGRDIRCQDERELMVQEHQARLLQQHADTGVDDMFEDYHEYGGG